MVGSRPIRSETQPKNGRVKPLVHAVDGQRQRQRGQYPRTVTFVDAEIPW